MSLSTNQALGVEALVRWQHARRGPLLPADFPAVAGSTGPIVPLGAWVLRTALEEVRDWRLHDGSRPTAHVKVSARQLVTAGFLEVVRDALDTTGVPAGALVLELTESLFLDNDAQSEAAINDLKHGDQVATAAPVADT